LKCWGWIRHRTLGDLASQRCRGVSRPGATSETAGFTERPLEVTIGGLVLMGVCGSQ